MAKDKTYAELKQQLDEVIAKIQSEHIGVDEAVNAYQEGTTLIKELQAYLKDSENKIKKLQKKA